MSHEAQIHEVQTKILRELLFLPATNFAELRKVSELDSDHVKFHIKRLVELGYVEKTGVKYKLSTKGKEYANKLDTDAGVIERQPKIAVMLVVEREMDGEKQYLVQKRLKHPFYGFWGAPTGKVRWGESILETASRELAEETGLVGRFEWRGIYHERTYNTSGSECLEDKVFNVMLCREVAGKMIDEFDGGLNVWRTLDEVLAEDKKYKSFEEEMNVGIKGVPFLEKVYHYNEDEF